MTDHQNGETRDMAQVCPNGHENADSMSFCGPCGAALTSPEPTLDKATSTTEPQHGGGVPKWLAGLVAVGLLVIVGAVIAILVVFINQSNANAAKDAETKAHAKAVAHQKADQLAQIPNAAKACKVDPSFVVDGGRKIEGSDDDGLSATEVTCVLEKLHAPRRVLTVNVEAGDPPKSVGWGDFTYTVSYPQLFGPVNNTIAASY